MEDTVEVTDITSSPTGEVTETPEGDKVWSPSSAGSSVTATMATLRKPNVVEFKPPRGTNPKAFDGLRVTVQVIKLPGADPQPYLQQANGSPQVS